MGHARYSYEFHNFKAQTRLTIPSSIKHKIEMNNDQTGLILPEMSILAGALNNIIKYSNQMCKHREHFSNTYAQQLKFRLLKDNSSLA